MNKVMRLFKGKPKSIEINISKSSLHKKITDYMYRDKQELVKELEKKKELKKFISSKVDDVYEKIEIFLEHGLTEEESLRLVHFDIYFK